MGEDKNGMSKKKKKMYGSAVLPFTCLLCTHVSESSLIPSNLSPIQECGPSSVDGFGARAQQ